MKYKNFLRGLLDSITIRKPLFKLPDMMAVRAECSVADIETLAWELLSGRGEASGVARAAFLLKCYEQATGERRLAFLLALADRFGPDPEQAQLVIAALQNGASMEALSKTLPKLEPRRQELIRRLNLAPGGTEALVRIRQDVLEHLPQWPVLEALDDDFKHLFSSWFNRGFLVLRRIDWSTPAEILEKLIRYEAVHAIRSWDDLRGRTSPIDRRCFAFFHPALPSEPLIFVEVALTRQVPSAIAPLIEVPRTAIDPVEATTAVFYSISSCQMGLAGISFGNFLIKQVVEDLRSEFPSLETFVTLSPVPAFAKWTASDAGRSMLTKRGVDVDQLLSQLTENCRTELASASAELREMLERAAAVFMIEAKTPSGRPIDPVARFHLGNGARLERLNLFADLSQNGLRQSHGLMANYRYILKDIERNHEAFAEKETVVAAPNVLALLKADVVPQRKQARA
ncbi:MAG TPA: malonyl-CoA decarboxylase [Xanthobacteraceae bacterium]|nr:malonyl-CoA decarboxylase [Xanthobacteraceae bacterium]